MDGPKTFVDARLQNIALHRSRLRSLEVSELSNQRDGFYKLWEALACQTRDMYYRNVAAKCLELYTFRKKSLLYCVL